jgi:hypothetical protein
MSTLVLQSPTAAHKIPETLIYEILSDVAYLNKKTWVQTIQLNGKGKVRLNKHSKLVKRLTSHIHEKSRQGRNLYVSYVEMYYYRALNTEDDAPLITGFASYHPLLLNYERDPTDSSKEFAYLFFKDDPNTFAWVCSRYDHRELDFVFDHGFLYKNNHTYPMVKREDGLRLVSQINQDMLEEIEPEPETQQDQDPDLNPEWFESFDVYLVR